MFLNCAECLSNRGGNTPTVRARQKPSQPRVYTNWRGEGSQPPHSGSAATANGHQCALSHGMKDGDTGGDTRDTHHPKQVWRAGSPSEVPRGMSTASADKSIVARELAASIALNRGLLEDFNPTWRDDAGRNLLHHAVLRNDAELVQDMLIAGVSVFEADRVRAVAALV